MDDRFFQILLKFKTHFWLFLYNDGKSFLLFFFPKPSPKCFRNALEQFKTSWLIQILDEFWLCVQGFVNCAQYLIPGQLLCFLYTLLSPNAMCILVRFQSILWAAGMWNPCVGSTITLVHYSSTHPNNLTGLFATLCQMSPTAKCRQIPQLQVIWMLTPTIHVGYGLN